MATKKMKFQSNSKRVYYDYFEVWCHKLDDSGTKLTEAKFDLEGILKQASKLEPKKTMRDYRSEKARVQISKYNTKKKLWELQLLRLREKSLPGLAKDNGEFKLIELEDGEYIGESTTLLYDSSNVVLVMQRNFTSFTPSGVEEYLNNIIENEQIQRIILKPIIIGVEIGKITKSKIYRSLTIGFTTKNQPAVDSTFLSGIIKHFDKYEGSNYKFEISVGRAKRDSTLSPGLIVDTIKELYEDNSITALKTSYKDDEDVKTEKVDLLNDRRQDFYDFPISKENVLTHERVYTELEKKYSKRKKSNTIY